MVRIITKTSFLPSMTVWGGCTVIAVPFRTKSMHWTSTTLSLPEWIMEFYKVALTFKSVDEILWGDHSNETFLSVLSHGATFFQNFTKWNFRFFCRILPLATFVSETAVQLYKSNKNQPSATASNENKMAHVESTYSFSHTFQHNIF